MPHLQTIKEEVNVWGTGKKQFLKEYRAVGK